MKVQQQKAESTLNSAASLGSTFARPESRGSVRSGKHHGDKSVSSKSTFKTSDKAFEMTAKLVVDYLTPKLPEGASSYHIDATDTIYLDAVMPQDVRPGFVEAVSFRAASLPSSGQLSPIESLVKECQRLGLGQNNCFLLGGGMKMDDGRILVLPETGKLGKVKKKKRVKQKSKINVTQESSNDLSWLQNSGLPPDQMKLIMSAMSDTNNSTKETENTANTDAVTSGKATESESKDTNDPQPEKSNSTQNKDDMI